MRVAEKTAAIADHKTAVANRALTSSAETLDADKEAAQKELDALGVIPEHADKSAFRLAKDVGKLVDLGPSPDETLIDWMIKFFAIIVEVIGLVGPRMILLSIYGDIERPARRWWWRWRQIEPDVSAKAVTVDMTHCATGRRRREDGTYAKCRNSRIQEKAKQNQAFAVRTSVTCGSGRSPARSGGPAVRSNPAMLMPTTRNGASRWARTRSA